MSMREPLVEAVAGQIALLGTGGLRGQTVGESEPFISTDRPSIANSSVVVPKVTSKLKTVYWQPTLKASTLLTSPRPAIRSAK